MQKKFLGVLVLIFAFWSTLSAQQNTTTLLRGTVQSEFGNPLEGVAVTSQDNAYKTTTNIDGAFSIAVDDATEALQFSLVGYSDKVVEVEAGMDPLTVELKQDAHKLNQVIHLGYSEQERQSISGSVSTVTGEELKKAPVANLTQSFPGRFSGLWTEETFSELSRANTQMFVRGLSSARGLGPLVMIDGIINAYNPNQTLQYISAEEIESITVLKDASTQALYGIQGANGLIVVNTKKGSRGELEIDTRIDQSFQQVTTTPRYYHSGRYAELRNQAAYNDGLGQNYFFSQEQIEKYRTGAQPNRYPNNNWYNRYMEDYAQMQRVGVNLSGGSENVQFFSNVNLMHQGGQFITDQPEYETDANNVWLNFRSNVDMELAPFLDGYVRLSGNIKRERTPGTSVSNVYSSIFQIPSNVYGPVTPEILDPSTEEVLVPGGKVLTTELVDNPTYGMLNRSGYIRHTVTNINSQVGLDLDMDFLTEGLSWSGAFAFQTNSVGSLRTLQDYERWIRTDDLDDFDFTIKGANNDTPLSYSKGHSYYYHLTFKTAMDYARNFGKHAVSGLAYMFYQDLTKADLSSPWCLPYIRLSSGAEATYGYDNRYFAKVDIGYSGSEQYAPDNRFTWTPAVSAAWLASNEAFLEDSDWLSLLKFRASYGKTGNDQSGLPRFAYLDNVSVTGGGPLGYLQYMVYENQVGNPNIAAEISTKQNVGLDLGLFNALTLSVDLYKERMENMVVESSNSVPLFQGVPLGNYPQTNTGIFENQGYDITLDYSRTLSKDLSFYLGAMYSYAKNEVVFWNEAPRTEDYAYQNWEEGFSFGQTMGFLVDYSNGNGMFNSEAELESSNLNYAFGTPRVGDLIYQDLNDDGEIDERDRAPLGNGALPRSMYSFSGGINYKSFELSALFQGVGDYSTFFGGMGVWETSYDGVFGSLHDKAWTLERYNSGEEILYPALSLSKSVNHEVNDFFMYDRSYLRLKNVELTYTLPRSVTSVINAETAKLVLSGQNLITWDNMKTDDFGPEGSYSSIPVYRVYNVGVSILF